MNEKLKFGKTFVKVEFLVNERMYVKMKKLKKESGCRGEVYF